MSADQPAGFVPALPYNSLPLLPPAADLETRAVLKACIRARAALAGLKHAADLLPNQAVLINTLPALEARASSEIEDIVTTADQLFRFAGAEDQADGPTKEALRYQSALMRGLASLTKRPLSTATAVQVCKVLRHVDLDIRKSVGTTLQNQTTREVIYTPPVGQDLLRSLLANWERFLHADDDLDPLIRMAVGHYQFEAIHPFADGNGRTGRILNLLFLVEQGLLNQPILYLSRAILRRRAEYYRCLNRVTSHAEWEAWILLMLEAVEETANWTSLKVAGMHELMQRCSAHARKHAPAIYSRELIEMVFTQPYCRIQDLVSAGIAQRQTAAVYLKSLSDAGILVEIRAGREKLFTHPNLLRVLGDDGQSVPRYVRPRRGPGRRTP